MEGTGSNCPKCKTTDTEDFGYGYYSCPNCREELNAPFEWHGELEVAKARIAELEANNTKMEDALMNFRQISDEVGDLIAIVKEVQR